MYIDSIESKMETLNKMKDFLSKETYNRFLKDMIECEIEEIAYDMFLKEIIKYDGSGATQEDINKDIERLIKNYKQITQSYIPKCDEYFKGKTNFYSEGVELYQLPKGTKIYPKEEELILLSRRQIDLLISGKYVIKDNHVEML
jgi:hypothetical protein